MPHPLRLEVVGFLCMGLGIFHGVFMSSRCYHSYLAGALVLFGIALGFAE